eukprot:2393931-Amphidinium_carterae.4
MLRKGCNTVSVCGVGVHHGGGGVSSNSTSCKAPVRCSHGGGLGAVREILLHLCQVLGSLQSWRTPPTKLATSLVRLRMSQIKPWHQTHVAGVVQMYGRKEISVDVNKPLEAGSALPPTLFSRVAEETSVDDKSMHTILGKANKTMLTLARKQHLWNLRLGMCCVASGCLCLLASFDLFVHVIGFIDMSCLLTTTALLLMLLSAELEAPLTSKALKARAMNI